LVLARVGAERSPTGAALTRSHHCLYPILIYLVSKTGSGSLLVLIIQTCLLDWRGTQVFGLPVFVKSLLLHIQPLVSPNRLAGLLSSGSHLSSRSNRRGACSNSGAALVATHFHKRALPHRVADFDLESLYFTDRSMAERDSHKDILMRVAFLQLVADSDLK